MFGIGRSFEKLHAKGLQATDAGEPDLALKYFQEAHQKAQGKPEQESKVLLSIGFLLTCVEGAEEAGRDALVHGFICAPPLSRDEVSGKVKAILGLSADLSVAELTAHCWEENSRQRLRDNDIQGCVDGMQQATATLSQAFGRNHGKMAGPMWRTMARLAGTSFSDLAPLMTQIADSAAPMIESEGADPHDVVWVLNYKAAALVGVGETSAVRAFVAQWKTAARATEDGDIISNVDALDEALQDEDGEFSFMVAPQELEELDFRGEGST